MVYGLDVRFTLDLYCYKLNFTSVTVHHFYREDGNKNPIYPPLTQETPGPTPGLGRVRSRSEAGEGASAPAAEVRQRSRDPLSANHSSPEVVRAVLRQPDEVHTLTNQRRGLWSRD